MAKIKKLSRSEVIDILFQEMLEKTDLNLKDIVLYGYEVKGLENMGNDELEVEYASHFGVEIKIEEKSTFKTRREKQFEKANSKTFTPSWLKSKKSK